MAKEEVPPIELGDRVIILGGTLDGTKGRVYYLGPDLLSILPDGATDRVVEIAIIDGELDPAIGTDTSIFGLSKRAEPAFVSQLDAAKDQIMESFGENGAPGPVYTVEEVNEEDDTLTLKDETGGILKLEFDFTGIPRSEPFRVLRPRMPASLFDEGAPGVEEGEDEFADVEPPPEVELTSEWREIPDEDQTFPDIVQRNDMFAELLASLPVASQKNPKQQKRIRQLIEQCILLRNDVVLYSQTRDPIGKLSTSFQTVLEMINRADIPLSRPVLDAKRTLYLDRSDDGNDPSDLPGTAVDIQYQNTVTAGAIDFLETQLGGTAEMVDSPDALPLWFLTWETFFKRYMRTWLSEGGPGEAVIFRGDKEFLRAHVPREGEDDELAKDVDGLARGFSAKSARLFQVAAEEEETLEAAGVGGVVAKEPEEEGEGGEAPVKRGKKKEEVKVTAASVSTIPLSLLKGLGPRSTRLKAKEPQRRIEQGDEGVIVNQLVFPLTAERDLGSTRSGRLSKDIAYSHAEPRSILNVIRDLGGVPDEATAGGILSIGAGGNTSGSIGIDDWLKAQPIHVGGLGDALVELKNLGLTQRELTADQQAVLVEKIKQFRALLKQSITEARQTSAKAISDLRLENRTFLQGEALEELLAVLKEEPLVAAYADEIRRRLPAYKENDIALFAAISAQMSDLLLTAMAGQPGPLARERNRRVRDQFIDALRKAMMLMQKKENAGSAPQPIVCPHVDSLTAIRKIKDDADRMKALAKFLANFQKYRKDNWIWCAASGGGPTRKGPSGAVGATEGDHQLLCYHEVLQLQEFLHPKEKEMIHKELLLAFSGGVFAGKYMCKNCGQPIAEMDFDSGMEFDDEGRPLAGRMVMVDEDAKAEEEMDQLLLGAPLEEADEIKFETEVQTLIYRTARELFDKIGIFCDLDSYRRIVQRVETEVQRQPSREDYAKAMKARAAKGEAKAPDYDVYINRVLVSAVGAHVLIEIQTKIPDFVIRFRIPGCTAGFSGFPMGAQEDKVGINYISCAISGIRNVKPPWGLTGFMAISNEKKRQEAIAVSIERICKEALKTSSVQMLLTAKRAHLEKLYGSLAGDKIIESVGAGFRPVPYFIKPEEAAEAVVVPEAATPLERARAWIQSGHRLAKTNGTFIKGSPFAETSCCYTQIGDPKGFWGQQGASLPALPAKEAPRGQAQTQSFSRFTPRKLARLLADPPEDLLYRVFLKVCFDGPRKGLPHEPGFTNQCPHCGFVFPENPYIVPPGQPMNKDLSKEWRAELDGLVLKGKTALESQQIKVDKSSFEDVLDASHRRFLVDIPERRPPPLGMALLQKLAELDPEPFEGWRMLMSNVLVGVSKLPPDGTADELAVAEAYGALSDQTVDVLGEIQRRLGADAAATLTSVLKQSITQCVESIYTYFLMPFQRLAVGFKPASFKVQSSYDLPPDTREDVQTALKLHLDYLEQVKKHVKGYTAMKLDVARSRLAVVLPILQREVRAGILPGGEMGLSYITASLILGILGEFINPNVAPAGGAGAGAGAGAGGVGGTFDSTARVPLNILEICINRLKAEGLNFTEEQIRDMIARRDQMELQLFIRKLDLPPDEKKMALRIKRMGLKEWGKGAANVYTLNAEQYERDREQRLAMGLVDFGQDAGTAAALAALSAEDMYGGGGAGAEAGYDVAQFGADD